MMGSEKGNTSYEL